MDRRTYLAALGGLATAGCISGPEGNGDPSVPGERTPTTGDGATPTPATESPTATPRRTPPAPTWAREFDSTADGSPVVLPGPGSGEAAVYVPTQSGGGDAGGLVALSLVDGSVLWRASLPAPVVGGPLSVYDGTRVYVVTGRDGGGTTLHALSMATGEVAWRREDAARTVVPLAATTDAVFLGRRDGERRRDGAHVAALSAADGGERWRVPAGDALGAHERADRLLVRTPGRLRALDVATGSERWQVGTAGRLYGPALVGKRVVVGDGDAVRAVGLGDGDEQWRRTLERPVAQVTAPLAAASSAVHVADGAGRVHALSPLDGSTRWTRALGTDGAGVSVAWSDGTLYLSADGVYALDPVSGAQQWAFVPESTGPVDVDASTTVFATAQAAGVVYALAPGGGLRWRYAPDGFVGATGIGSTAFVAERDRVRALEATDGG